jgi:hypothetical protein
MADVLKIPDGPEKLSLPDHISKVINKGKDVKKENKI